ncbi:hypothetical protein Agabi119p4_4208 [Agaricus bisporus var. burnettii]|uniref:Autophagy-related protein 29 n=1 Tax=Agaricus bisporus var. burnettii TaxID=192524 RepID=A0A8H7KH40_AGABI|nr:hypothetical protein Agabi119p4_4208 [Agaricus bisporus var. burnettii]
MPQNTPSVRVVVRLPWNRPENAEPDPPHIEWTQEKADILWKVIEKSRSSDSSGADWKGLAAHLEVPLPYLLYRVNARFQEEIRGLKDIQGALSPSSVTSPNPKVEVPAQADKPVLAIRTGLNSKLSSSRLSTPRDVHARLNSLVTNSPRPKKVISSSTITVQGIKRSPGFIRTHSPLSSDDGVLSDEDETILKEEEAERNAEEQETVDRKLEELTRLINADTLGLVRTHRPRRSLDRERTSASPSNSSKSNSTSNANSAAASFRGDSLSSVRSDKSENQSLSSAISSPPGSIPEIPSPRSDSQSHSPMYPGRQNDSPEKSASPAAVSSRSALSHSHNRRHAQLLSEHESSEASSFSDLSDASLSASALESALMSNIAGMRTTPAASRLTPQFNSRSRIDHNTHNPSRPF